MKSLWACSPLLIGLIATNAFAFAAAVTPPRLELEGKAGTSIREAVEITNAAATPATYIIRTADWSLSPKGELTFHDALQPDSCRPWVALEAREITLPAGARRRFRIQLTVPPDAADRECRFVMVLEGKETQAVQSDAGPMRVNGRIGVIVYLAVGAARPDLRVVRAAQIQSDGQNTPILVVANEGGAHGRLAGMLDAITDKGETVKLAPSSLPVLPGASLEVSFQPVEEGGPASQCELATTPRRPGDRGDGSARPGRPRDRGTRKVSPEPVTGSGRRPTCSAPALPHGSSPVWR